MNGIPSHIDPDLIRRLADGELDDAARAHLEQTVPKEKLTAAVTFEQSLRAHISRVVTATTPSAPQELREKIRAALQSADAVQSDEPIARIEPGAGGPAVVNTTPRRFSSANYLAVAASLALVAGAVLFGIFGPPIDQWGQNPGVSTAAEISQFASGEHDRCAIYPNNRKEKIEFTDPDICRARLSERLGLQNHHVIIFDLDAEDLGYAFIGGGSCVVPTYERSAHLMYRRDSEVAMPAMASIFIGSGKTNSQLAPGEWKELPFAAGCSHAVFTSTDGTLDYLLVCCDANDIAKLRKAIGEQLRAADNDSP